MSTHTDARPGETATTVRAFLAGEWPVYRALRLQALQDTPDAFGSTWAEEAARPVDAWQERLRAGVASGADLPLLALAAGVPAGLCWAKQDADDSRRVHLFQMWVAPEHRGIGLGRQLLRGAIDWASARGAQSLCLGVTLGDSSALRLYRAAGFVAEGEAEALRPGSALCSQAMRLALSAPAA
jgi:ribosomal protein S18 acetylase RimI-like enzyme